MEVVVGLYRQVVDGDSRAEVCGFRAYQISVAFGIAKAVDMGVETMRTRQVVDTVGDFLLDITVAVVAIDATEEQGRDRLSIKKNTTDILRVDDDVYIVVVDVGIGVVMEGGEGDLVDALLDGSDPNHRWVTGVVYRILVGRVEEEYG